MTTDLTERVEAAASMSTETRLTMTECALLSLIDAIKADGLTIMARADVMTALHLAIADGQAVLRGEEIDY